MGLLCKARESDDQAATIPPMCIKLSTKGVKPIATFSIVAIVRQTTPEPFNVHRAQKLTMISAQLAPTRPKTEADAPTDKVPGRKTIDTTVPKRPESM